MKLVYAGFKVEKGAAKPRRPTISATGIRSLSVTRRTSVDTTNEATPTYNRSSCGSCG
jgi:hypothetical protein